MNVFYEDSGSFKVGSIISRGTASFQIDTQYGKRTKLKTQNILLEFNSSLNDFLPSVQSLAADIDVGFLWECCGENEFNYVDLAADYWGHTPTAIESAAIAMRLYNAPIYFYKKGKGRYKAATAEALEAALASIERKQHEQERIKNWVAELKVGNLPKPIADQLIPLLFRPDKNTVEFKAFEQARAELGISALCLAMRVGGITSMPDYLMAGFLFEHFPKGPGFSQYTAVSLPAELPLATAKAFSIDDATTTEIDDAFSLADLPNGNKLVGIHIAAPTLGISPGSELEQLVYARLSTVYYPGGKITMLPSEAIEHFSLKEGKECPALSLYVEVTQEFEVVAFSNSVEMVTIVANLRHHTLESWFNEQTLAANATVGGDYPYKAELIWLWQFALALEKQRGKGTESQRPVVIDYSIDVVDSKVVIISRKRGAPIDKLVSELMILANCEWGRQLAVAGVAGLYRAQSVGKVKMTTRAEPHIGLGVAQYAWSTSPLRRAIDFVNQRQLIALIRGEKAPFEHGDAKLFAVLRDFEVAYSAYLMFQDKMERFWCLRWLSQQQITQLTATYIKEDWVRAEGAPLRLRVCGLPQLASGERIHLGITRIDELMLEVECRFINKVEDQQAAIDDDLLPLTS